MARFGNSIDKILNYCKEIDKDYLYLSPNLFRSLKCNSYCGACCPRFSLDYLKGGERWEKFKETYPDKVHLFTEREYEGATYHSFTQEEFTSHHCSLVDMSNGLCTIHKANPFSCDFEVIKLQGTGSYTSRGVSLSLLLKKSFGRAWAMTKVDGTKGTLCEFLPFDKEVFKRDISILEELQDHYQAHFKKKNIKLQVIVDYLRDNFDTIQYDPNFYLIVDNRGEFVTREEVMLREKEKQNGQETNNPI